MRPTLSEGRKKHRETVLNERIREQSSSFLMSLVKHANVLLQISKLNAKGSVKRMPVKTIIDTELLLLLKQKLSKQLHDKIEPQKLNYAS